MAKKKKETNLFSWNETIQRLQNMQSVKRPVIVNPDYKIEVSMTPHRWDNSGTPYFWCVLKCTAEGWMNDGSGWAKTPEEAFKIAKEVCEELQREDENL